MGTVAVLGAGGFVGGHLTKRLVEDGHEVWAVDKKDVADWYQANSSAVNVQADLMHRAPADAVCSHGLDEVFLLAADMGGIGHIETHRADCAFNSQITMNVLRASVEAGVGKLGYSSSACIYPSHAQDAVTAAALREIDAYPAMAEPGYGWSKLFDELLCEYVTEDWGLPTRIFRFHNIFGPFGTYKGGREKAPAAICRKVAEAQLSGCHEIEIWGDGEQTRSFCYVDDCVEGVLRIMASDCSQPLNLGSDELVSVNELVTIVEGIAGTTLTRRYDLTAAQGVRGRNSDNTLIKQELGWAPSIPLRVGLEKTYAWVYDQVKAQL